MRELKLYVWEDVLTDYTSGIMFALATSPDHARQLLREKLQWVYISDVSEIIRMADDALAQAPKCVETPRGFVVWGGE